MSILHPFQFLFILTAGSFCLSYILFNSYSFSLQGRFVYPTSFSILIHSRCRVLLSILHPFQFLFILAAGSFCLSYILFNSYLFSLQGPFVYPTSFSILIYSRCRVLLSILHPFQFLFILTAGSFCLSYILFNSYSFSLQGPFVYPTSFSILIYSHRVLLFTLQAWWLGPWESLWHHLKEFIQ